MRQQRNRYYRKTGKMKAGKAESWRRKLQVKIPILYLKSKQCPLRKEEGSTSIRKGPPVKQHKECCQKVWEHLQQMLWSYFVLSSRGCCPGQVCQGNLGKRHNALSDPLIPRIGLCSRTCHEESIQQETTIL